MTGAGLVLQRSDRLHGELRNWAALITGIVVWLALTTGPALCELLPGYTYHFEGVHTREICNPARIRLHLRAYVTANNRDLLIYTTDGGGVRLNLQRVKSMGHTAAAKFAGHHNRATAVLRGNDLTIAILGTNPRGGQARYTFRMAVHGQSCQATGLQIELGGCGSDGHDARPDRCRVHSGRPGQL
jgi:hypothetical protein